MNVIAIKTSSLLRSSLSFLKTWELFGKSSNKWMPDLSPVLAKAQQDTLAFAVFASIVDSEQVKQIDRFPACHYIKYLITLYRSDNAATNTYIQVWRHSPLKSFDTLRLNDGKLSHTYFLMMLRCFETVRKSSLQI